MAKKPAGLIYGVGDKPPLTATILLGLQHVFVMTSGWVIVVVIVATIGGSQEEVANVLRMSMIASGIATILQSLPNSPVGSGYFCPISGGPAYITASILAGKVGGLRSVFSITVISGLFEGLLARVVPRLRPLFPPQVTGLVVTMVGIGLVALGCPRLFGFQEGSAGPQGTATMVGAATLAVMIGPTVWGKGQLKLYPVLVGLTVGYLLAHFFGAFQTERLQQMLAAPMVSLPRKAQTGWSFD